MIRFIDTEKEWDEGLGWLIEIVCSECGKTGKTSMDTKRKNNGDVLCMSCALEGL